MPATPPPRLTLHHLPPAEGQRAPDCECDSCREVRRAWEAAEGEAARPRRSPLGDPLCPDCGDCYVMRGDPCPICLARRIATHDKRCTCPPCAALHEHVPSVRSWSTRRLVCVNCQRDLGSAMSYSDSLMSVRCIGCEREGR